MMESDYSKRVRRVRTENRDMPKAGYEKLGEGGGKVWELVRGYRVGYKITDAKVAADGVSVWVKCEDVRKTSTALDVPREAP